MLRWIERQPEVPEFPVGYRSRAKSLLNVILWSILVTALAVASIVSMLIPTEKVITLVVGTVTAGIALLLRILMHRDRVKTVSISLSFLVFVVVTFNLYFFGGVRNSVGYFLVIIIAALLLGGRTAVGFGLLSILAIIGVFYIHDRGVVISDIQAPLKLIDILIIVPFLALAVLLLHFAVRSIAEGFEEARQSKVGYRRLVEQVPAISYTAALDEVSTTLYVSPQIETLLGVTPAKWKSDPDFWRRRLHPEDRDRVIDEVRRSHESGEQLRCEYRLIASDGRVVWFRDEAAVVRDYNGRPLFLQGTMQDITDRKKAEEALQEAHERLELRVRERTAELASLNEELQREIGERQQMEQKFIQSQKMEAIGRLAGGVAHDFNNLLTAITGYTDLLLKKTVTDEPVHRRLKEIQKAADRAAALIQQLLAFSRKQILQPRLLNLNDVITEVEKMLHRLIGEDIELSTVLEPELCHVKADPVQMEQVILNLAVNARDAMPEGGRLIIETANVQLDDAYALTHINVKTGPYVMMAVSDTGIGMDRETQSRIFEPFFTTKKKGEGTGLGLATIYGIVTQSGGNIDVSSEPARGTTFRIYFPPAEKVAGSTKSKAAVKKGMGGSETIVVVEDEDMVRDLIREVLEEKGYTVLEASRAQEALGICRQYPSSISLLITDVVMPGGMSGRNLAKTLAKSRPEIRVLYISGYTDNAIVHHGVLDGEVAFLKKPFTPDGLAHKVREVLDQ